MLKTKLVPVARLSEFEWVRKGVASVDSLSIDPHKWLFAPIGVGCLLLRDEAQAKAHFQMNADYTKVRQTDPSETHAFFDLGFELSRPNRALKFWAILKTHGIDRLVQTLEGQIELRRYLQGLLEAEERIEVLGAGLSAVCFRYLPAADATERQIGAANNRLLESLSL
ncbi:MAG: hypothetical protein JKY61_10500 [Planctomycetes bacterium]|nr:hypothetical protein [Planctomycetota bacterium]